MPASASFAATKEIGSSRPLQLVIYRPHANIWFRNTLGRLLKRTPLPNKYAPLLDYLLDSEVVLSFASCLEASATFNGFMQRIRDAVELFLWCVFNRISLGKVSLIFTRRALVKRDVLFLMHYGNFAYETEVLTESGQRLARSLAELDIAKVVHLTHYAYCTTSGAANLAALQPRLLVAENNLERNSLFYRTYFAYVGGEFHCLPYTPAARFQARKPFAQRTNKMVVTGSITYKMKSPEFIEFFQVNELQPLRRKLYEQAGDYLAQMECMISDLDASRSGKRESAPNRWRALVNRLLGDNLQQAYYKKDIVDLYNSYTMFAVPEEVCDLPAIGFVEGMACGTAYLGQVNPMYEDLGMVPGVHYIGYDGTLGDLMAQVSHYQQHPVELARIASEGTRFAREQLSAHTVYGNFIERLYGLIRHSESGR